MASSSRDVTLGSLIIVLLMLMPSHNLPNSMDRSTDFSPRFDHNQSILEVVNRLGGSPSDAIPLGNRLIVAVADCLEVRSSTFEILSDLVLPSPAVELDALENGDLVVTLQPEGLALVRVSESGISQLLDYFEEGTWTGLDAGDGIFCAWLDYRERFQMFNITNDEIKTVDMFQSTGFVVDGSRVVWENVSTGYCIMDTSVSDSPIQFQFGHYRIMELNGDLLIGSWEWDWATFYTLIANISQVLEGSVPENLGGLNFLVRQVVAWSSDYIYTLSPSGFAILNLTNHDNIDFVEINNPSQFSRIGSHEMISSNNLSFVCVGLNSIEWWDIHNPLPSLFLEGYFPGYLTDVVMAQDVVDPIVWKAFEIDDPVAQREFGYPFVTNETYPVIADLVDLKVVDSHVYEFMNAHPEILYWPRMEPHLFGLGTQEYPHPREESLVYNGLFYRMQNCYLWEEKERWHNVLFSWDPANLSVATEQLRLKSRTKRLFYLMYIQDGFYIAGDADTLVAINLDTLDYVIGDVDLGTSPKMIRAYEDSLFVIDETGISMFDIRSDWLTSIALLFSSRIEISAEVFEVHSNWVYAANTTHLMKLSYDDAGGLHYEGSIQLPTLLHKPSDVDEIEAQEPGELLIDAKSNSIYRTAGTYGMWVVHDSAMDIPDMTSTTETPTTTAYFQPDFDWALLLMGGVSGLAIVLVSYLVFRKMDDFSYSS